MRAAADNAAMLEAMAGPTTVEYRASFQMKARALWRL